MTADSPLAWVAIDFLCCLLLVVYTMIGTRVEGPGVGESGHGVLSRGGHETVPRCPL